MPTPVSLTAQHDGRYSDGTHSMLLPERITKIPPGLRPEPWYCSSDSVTSTQSVIWELEIVIVSVSVRIKVPVESKDKD
jgi:hypothetical protein